jgi:hypothetical protein
VERLILQDIVVKKAVRPFTAQVRNFYSLDTTERREFRAGSYLIDFVQPQAQLVRALLDPTLNSKAETVVEVPFTAEMPYYDATWGVLTYLFGIPAYGVNEPLEVESHRVIAVEKLQGRIEKLKRSEPPYAYIIQAGRESSYRTAIQLMREGYRLRVFQGSFRIREKEYPKATWAALRQRNPEGLRKRLAELADEHSTQIVEVAGPYTDAGITFGDDRQVAAVPTPMVAVLADWPVTQDHTFGGIRNVLEADFGFVFSPVMLETINTADLSRYTAVVLPHAGTNMRAGPGFGSGYRGKLNLDNLQRFVQGGGTLLVVGGASEEITSDPVLGKDVSFDGWAKHTNGVTLRAEWVTGLMPEPNVMPWQPGLDRIGFPLIAAGYQENEFSVPGIFPPLLSVSEGGSAEVVARYTDDPDRLLLDGFMLESDKQKIAGRPFVVIQPAGQGRVIYFADDITFRGYWYGLNLLFLNSLIFGPTL